METQLKHCAELLALLNDLDPAQYDHNVFRISALTRRCCAMGHAARAGIGGLRIGTAWAPWLVTDPHLMIDEAADVVFGPQAWERVFNVEALNARLGIADHGVGLQYAWTIGGAPATEDEVWAAGRGAAALDAVKAALAEHMVLPFTLPTPVTGK